MSSLKPVFASALGCLIGVSIASAQHPVAPTPISEKPKPVYGEQYIQAAQEKLNATFTNFKFDEVRASELPGVVEIYAGPRIMYYAPEQNILILGEFYAANGVSITEQKVGQFAVRKAEDLDKSSALELGGGDTELIAFVDPDCRYCRQAYEWLNQQDLKSVKQLVFFMPMNGRPQAQARAAQALCAPPADRQKALEHVFSPTTPASGESVPPECADGQTRLAAHAQIATKIGVYATPFFIVKGQVVAGFDRQRLTTLLAQQNQKGDRP